MDNGGFFPEQDNKRDVAWFLMDAMRVLGTSAIGVGERDLRFGLAYLQSQIKRTGAPVVSSNLLDKKTHKPVTQPYVIVKAGTAKVGFFSLLGTKTNLGPAQDSLSVADPATTAKQTIAELHKKGAGVVVLLSQLGKVDSEDLVTEVQGIDAVVVGRDTPVIPKGRMIKSTVACYGGEKGQYLCRTELTLDAQKHSTTGEAESVVLGPEVGENAEVLKLVKSFEDGFNEKLRKAEIEKAAKQSVKASDASGEHFLGSELCTRCHVDEGKQWKTTSHSMAWSTLVAVKKDATPDCVPCHVVGFKQPGGFQSGTETPERVNVQCENCHGMGTQHEAFATNPHRVTEQTCVTCHHGENDPEFNFEKKLPMIAHGNMSGETLKRKKVKTGSGSSMMTPHESHK